MEYCFLVFLLDADSLIFDDEHELALFLVEADIYDDVAAVGVLDGILDYVNRHLLETIWVPYHESWKQLVLVDVGDVVQQRMVINGLVAN